MQRSILLVGLVAQLCAASCETSGASKKSETKGGHSTASSGGPTFLEPSEGPVASAVRTARREVGDDPLLVYVSADWCEPCRHFQSAVEKGLLDKAFPRLRLLKFDSDVDEARLAADGYGGHMIPRFVQPAEDGTASGSRFEGSIKGPGAVDNIVPKLKDLLAQ